MLKNQLSSLDVKTDVHDKYNEVIDEGNRRMAWGLSDVNSWYKNASGRTAQNWPFSLLEYWEQTREINADDYNNVEFHVSHQPNIFYEQWKRWLNE